MNSRVPFKLLCILVFLSLPQCSRWEQAWPVKLISKSFFNHNSIIKENSVAKKRYDFFNNIFQSTLLFLNQKVQHSVIERKKFYYHWGQETYNEKTRESIESSQNKTEFFLSFYTYHVKINKLHIPAEKWKAYLFANGKKYEARIIYVSDSYESIKAFYPFYDRFSRAYKLSFPIPLKQVESKPLTVLLTGHLGSVEFKFNQKLTRRSGK